MGFIAGKIMSWPAEIKDLRIELQAQNKPGDRVLKQIKVSELRIIAFNILSFFIAMSILFVIAVSFID